MAWGHRKEGVWGDSAPPKKKDLGGHTHHDSVLVLWVWVLGTRVEMGRVVGNAGEEPNVTLQTAEQRFHELGWPLMHGGDGRSLGWD